MSKRLMPQDEWIEKSGLCPRCENDQNEYENIEVDGPEAIQVAYCHECDFEWNEVYTLARYEAKK